MSSAVDIDKRLGAFTRMDYDQQKEQVLSAISSFDWQENLFGYFSHIFSVVEKPNQKLIVHIYRMLLESVAWIYYRDHELQ